jgi:hypothetical protein
MVIKFKSGEDFEEVTIPAIDGKLVDGILRQLRLTLKAQEDAARAQERLADEQAKATKAGIDALA